ncbi:GTP-binding protein [Candidatus Micrarchaeota archaeon]|nr:GTP-binding protein [Candidatus Micrarchaeota archaeon]
MDSAQVLKKIKEIEDEIHRTQKNKATEYHIGILKAKIAKLKRMLYAPSGRGGGGGFDIRKSGDATAVMIGFPSVGKSTLLNKITNAESQIGAYEFTTLNCIPGMMKYKDAYIQVLDLPGIIKGATRGKGRGREIISVAMKADIIIILLDSKHPEHYQTIMKELYDFGVRLDKMPPDVVVKPLIQGGVTVTAASAYLKNITKNEIIAALNEYGIYNANVMVREKIGIEEFIDVLEGNRKYIPSVVVVNKIDEKPPDFEEMYKGINYLAISAENELGLERLREKIYGGLKFIRIFTKRRGEKVDLEEALIMRAGNTVEDVCVKLHKDLKKNFKYAIVWGKSVKHPAQRVGLAHKIADGDIVQIVTR